MPKITGTTWIKIKIVMEKEAAERLLKSKSLDKKAKERIAKAAGLATEKVIEKFIKLFGS